MIAMANTNISFMLLGKTSGKVKCSISIGINLPLFPLFCKKGCYFLEVNENLVLELLVFSTRPILKIHINRQLHYFRQLKKGIIEVLGKDFYFYWLDWLSRL